MSFESQSIAGYNGVLYVSLDGGTTWIAVGELQDVKLKVTTKMMDATSHSTQGWDDNIPGNSGWTATVGQLSIFADAGQAAITAAIAPKTKLGFRFDPAGTGTGLPRRTGNGFITDWEETQPKADLQTTALTISGAGALAFSAQP